MGAIKGKVMSVFWGIRGQGRVGAAVALALGAALVLGGCVEPFKQLNWRTTLTLPLIERSQANGHQIMLDGTANPSGEEGANLLGQSLSALLMPQDPALFYQDLPVYGSEMVIPPDVDLASSLGTFPVVEREFPFLAGLVMRGGTLEFTDVKLAENLRLALTVTLTASDANGFALSSQSGTVNLENNANRSLSFDSFFAGLAGDAVAKMKVSASGYFERVDPSAPVVVQPDPGKSTASVGAAVQVKVDVGSYRVTPPQTVPALLGNVAGGVTRLESGSLVLTLDNLQSSIAFHAALIVSDEPDPYSATGLHRAEWSVRLEPRAQTTSRLELGPNELALLAKSPLYVGLELANDEAPGTTGVTAGAYLEAKAFAQVVAQVRKLVGGGGQQ